MKNVIIGKGLIGNAISKTINPDKIFDTANIHTIKNSPWDTIYCAAPSGNRLLAEKESILDRQNINALISHCESSTFKRFVLFSTADTQIRPNSEYGKNRLILEHWTKSLPNSTIIRLAGLIHETVTKGIFYDIKHKCWLDKINPNNTTQWINLDRLKDWIDSAETEINVCSSPILVRDIVERFAPEVLNKLNHDAPGTLYDLKPYSYTKEEIFLCIEKYLNET